MLIKLLGILTLISQLNNSAYSSNMKLLDMEAETYKNKLWSKILISEEDIKNSLFFIYDPKAVDKKYSIKSEFDQLYQREINDVKEENFLKFANICNEIYEQNDTNIKKSVHMLFERVSKKYNKDYKMLQKLKNFGDKNRSNGKLKLDNSKIFEMYLNADKNIHVN